MKKFNKLVLCSLVLALCVAGVSFFGRVKDKPVTNISTFYGYNDSYTTNTEETHLKKIELTENYTSLPSSYDLRDYIDIKVENQKTYGICYAFGSLTMLETYLALIYNEYYDFSEIHMATSKYTENGTIVTNSSGNVVDSDVDFDSIYGGGNFYNFYDYCMKNAGPVLESEMPFNTFYSPYDVETIEDYAEEYYNTYRNEFSKIVTVNQFVTFLDSSTLSDSEKITNRNNIKQHIKTYGSCSSGIYSSSFGVYNNTQYLNSYDNPVNHMISIIGWDDNYKPSSWENAGAYLCLNSWGQDVYNGVFYVSYDDVNIETDVYGISDAELHTPNNIVSNYENYKNSSDGTLAKTASWSITSSSTNFVSTITDVSNKLNSYINEIDLSVYYPTSTAPEIHINFTDTLDILNSDYSLNDSIVNLVYNTSCPTVKSYSNITNYNSSLSGDTIFNIKLSTPVKITGKYAVIILKTNNMFRIQALDLPINSTNPLLNTYWKSTMTRIISGDNTSMLMLTRFKTTDSQTYNTDYTTKFVNQKLIPTTSGYTYNNATSIYNTMTVVMDNPTSDLSSSKVEIYSVSSNTTTLTKNDVTSHFDIVKSNSQISFKLTQNLGLGIYIVKITSGNYNFYKSFELLSISSIHTITYNLNGGKNNSENLTEYSEDLSSLKIYHPTKTGYEFLGWYTDNNLTNKLSGTDLSDSYGNYTEYSEDLSLNLTLFAKWEISSPTIITQPNNVLETYNGTWFTLSCEATHILGNSNIKYQWYKDDVKITDANYKSLLVKNVSDNGTYFCEISIETKSLRTNEVQVNISKANYYLSLSTTSFNYDGTTKTVDVKNANSDIVYTILNNSYKDAGKYTAVVNFTSWNENYNKPSINNLNWEIKPAELIVKIQDVSVSSMEDLNTFNDFDYTLLGTIYDNYSLNLQYTCIDTENEYIKLITASYNPTTNYNVTVNPAYLKIAKQTLTNKINDVNISTYNELGYVTDSSLTVSELKQQDLSANNQKYIEDNGLIVYNIYDIQVDDPSVSTVNIITIDISEKLADKNLKVYRITENGMELVTSNISDNKLTFTTDEFGKFLIVETPKDESIIPILVSLGIILLAALFCCLMVAMIRKHRNKKYYSNINSIPH